jgi:hypothetical protein
LFSLSFLFLTNLEYCLLQPYIFSFTDVYSTADYNYCSTVSSKTEKDLEVKKQYQIEITNRFAALGNIRDDEDINRA